MACFAGDEEPFLTDGYRLLGDDLSAVGSHGWIIGELMIDCEGVIDERARYILPGKSVDGLEHVV